MPDDARAANVLQY